MNWLEAVILGIVQGLTEFLPVSSSGHLTLAREILGIPYSGNVTFEVLVHAATVLSTITVFGKEIWNIIAGLFKFKWNDETQYACKILVSMIPILIVGLFFKDTVESFFGSSVVLVGVMLLVTALLLALTQFVKFKERHGVTFGNAFLIGCAQAVAVLPGLSRSGSTIAAGLLAGVRKEDVAQFSFLMVIIPILGEAFLDLVGGEFSVSQCGIPATSLLCGFVAAYLSGLAACKLMIRVVKKANLIWFSLYCLIVGLIAIIAGLC
ncbi:MAG: undecaprenyl-diphosphate phosphatase [Bacteroidales bacterium]|nr:undecaprenyl-diphosphate phosphatase [Bacteroidales bacterium]MDY6348558.1 undecaprenyl-diphosphate phosphatase [Bacteroidales bacterium]